MAKYDPLREHLKRSSSEPIEISFAEIDTMVGGLPESARTYRAWWENEVDGHHVQARAWLDAGLKVDWVDFSSELVRFRRTVH